MEKLRATIEQYRRWKELGQYIDRMEGHLETDFSVSVENAKALLESIGKEICNAKKVELAATSSINGVLKSAFLALGYPNDNLVNQVSRSLANIGGEIGNLRNEISPTSHGKSLDELRDRNNKVDALTRGFLIDSTLVVAVFLIRAFEERKDAVALTDASTDKDELLNYEALEFFNSFWDEAYGEFQMGEYSYTASEILFNVDYKAYKTEFSAFKEAALDALEAAPGEQQ
jgi:hypothetical protein